MSEPNLPVQVQDGQQFDSLATFKWDMIRCAVNSGEMIKTSKIDKKSVGVRNLGSFHMKAKRGFGTKGQPR
jgi:hypothetical protein